MSKIALVDDDRNILTSVSMTLEAEGFEVETYNDGQAALDAFNKKLPDMAVLDIKMLDRMPRRQCHFATGGSAPADDISVTGHSFPFNDIGV